MSPLRHTRRNLRFEAVGGVGFRKSEACEMRQGWIRRFALIRWSPLHAAPVRRADRVDARAGSGSAKARPSAQDAAEACGAGGDDLALGRGDRRARDRSPARRLAEDRASLARPLAVEPRGGGGRRAAFGRPAAGAPATFAPEQICAIVALACEPPEQSDLPLSHWSQSELAREAVRRGIVDSISHGSVGRFLKRGRPQAASRARLAHAQAGP